MERLLLVLVQMECESATWLLAVQREQEARSCINRAIEFLGALDVARRRRPVLHRADYRPKDRSQ